MSAPFLERVFDFVPREAAYDIDEVEGEMPAIDGRYFLNGPARFVRGDLKYRHWLDGDGMVSSLAFSGHKARFRNRFVAGAKYLEEEAAGAPLYRAFGTSFPGDRLKRGIGLESPLNVSVFACRSTLLAFGEQGLPYSLDPETLETCGEYNFGGKLNAISPLSAHPCFDPSLEMFNFGISFAQQNPSLTLYRFSHDEELLYRRRVPIDWPASVHDFILSPNFLIVYLSPYLLDVEAMMRGGRNVMEALSWRPDLGSQLLIFDKATGEPRAKIAIGQRYCLHLINAFEEDGNLSVDVVELERPVYPDYQVVPNLFEDAPPGQPRRLVVDRASWQVVGEKKIAYKNAPDFPALDPALHQKPYDDFSMLGIAAFDQPGAKLFNEIVHLSWSRPDQADLWQAPLGSYLGGEPIFLRDRQGRGLTICQLFDAEKRKSSFLIFEAANLAQGPIARLGLKYPIPPGFHASFAPA